MRPETIDAYLESLDDDQRDALEKLRRAIRAAAPGAEECITYGKPGFRQDGMLVAFGAASGHCALYPMSETTVALHSNELARYDTSKGTIRFQPAKPLPAALVKKLVKSRLAENAAKVGARGKGAGSAKEGRTRSAKASTPDPAVEDLLLGLKHPLGKEIDAVRRIIRGVDPSISEGVKWNAPSFRTSEWFATVNLRSRDQLRLVFHLGAKARGVDIRRDAVPDPSGLIEWLAKDRCMVTLGAGRDIARNRIHFEAIVKAWIGFLESDSAAASQAGATRKRAAGERTARAAARGEAAPGADEVLAMLKRKGVKKIRDEMGPKYGNHTEKAFGVSMADMKVIAKGIGRDHQLAQALWETGWYEARMVATMIDDPAMVTAAQMDRWRRDFDNWGLCDTACFCLFDRSPHALGRVDKWRSARDEFGKRAAFALLACLALHGEGVPDDAFLERLPFIEEAASDDRNFVKKGVSWALRAIGQRNRRLHAAAVALATQLTDSSEAAPRWIGKDALRELRSPAVKARLAARKD